MKRLHYSAITAALVLLPFLANAKEHINRLGARISDIIGRHLQRNKARESVMRTAAVLYPGFLEYLQNRYGFTETDLFYTSMLLCGFSNTSISVITGNKCSSVMVDKSRIAAKIGVKEKLSSYISTRLKDFT